MPVSLAHVGDLVGANPPFAALLAFAVVFGSVLFLEHLYVKHGGLSWHQLRRAFAVLAVFCIGAAVAPAAGLAQLNNDARGLPDLVSDPPFIWRTRDIKTPQGDVIRVMTFDGYIHNIGTGKLEVSGNPQIEGGMEQRVFDGEVWTTVAQPTVRFETDDGHNHFHLIRAIDYALWSDDRSEQVTDASKVGFCLVDTEQMEEGYDSNYLIEDFNYCGVDDPDATDLTMGITPGWRDTYDANVTMQWVDISNVLPGRYWTSAVTDPNNEIVESNEDNNTIVFSANKFEVDGYLARELEPQNSSEPIVLKVNTYGVVGARAFVISSGPENGTLDVPLGVDLIDINTIEYTPNAGFSGTDTFTYYAHDVTTPFPHEPLFVEVSVQAGAATTTDDPPSPERAELTILEPGDQQTAMYEIVDMTIEAETAGDDNPAVRWFSRDLPSGLAIDIDTGVISGIPSFAGNFESTVVAVVDDARFERSISWSVAEREPSGVPPTRDFSSSGGTALALPIGTPTDGATYQGVGLPDGGFIVSNLPIIGGLPQESGTFMVEMQELIDGEIVSTVEFEWTVRPSTRPAFLI